MKILKKTLIALLALILIPLLSVFIYLFSVSSGKAVAVEGSETTPLKNSIYEIETKTIGNLQQKLIIYGQNKENPVLLFLHGGPGMPVFPMVNAINKELEKHVTIVYWQQRGSSVSPVKESNKENLNIDLFINDTIEISEYLKTRFKKKKIYLMGQSWGALLAMLVIDKRPDLFKAYLGISQLSNWTESDNRAYQWALKHAKESGNTDALIELENLAPYSSTDLNKKGVLLSYVSANGAGVMHDMSKMFSALILPLLTAREYTLGEKMNYFPVLVESSQVMIPDLLSINLFKKVPKIKIPIYILHGKHDQQANYSISKEYFNYLKAPKKKFITFENSAHGMIMEEPEKYRKIVIEDFLKNN